MRKLIKKLREFDSVCVTGTQRSGTTIGAMILADLLGYEFLPEEAFTAGDAMVFFNIFNTQKNIVVQAPGMCHLVHELCHPNVAVVYMLRNPKEVQNSEDHIGYYWYGDGFRYFTGRKMNYLTRLHRFRKFQAPLLKERVFYLKYEKLDFHRLFVSKEKRVNFAPRQVSDDLNFSPSIEINYIKQGLW